MGQPGDVQLVRVANDRHDQSLGRGDGEAEVDPFLDDDLIAAPGGVHSRRLAEGFHHRSQDEGHIGERHSFLPLEIVADAAAQGDQSGNVNLHRAPGVRNLGGAPDHCRGNHSTDGRNRQVLLVAARWGKRRGGHGRDRRLFPLTNLISLINVAQDVVSGDAAAEPATGDPAYVD